MPDIARWPLRMDCRGIDLVNPIDRMPPGAFPYLFNARVLEEGRIDGRPGYSSFISMADIPNSIRRLNDPDMVYAPQGYIYVGGGGTNLYAGPQAGYTIIAGGFSGNPLSLITFRPDQSPESWMYVYDANKQVKVRPDGQIRAIGVAPPTKAPSAEYGPPAMAVLTDGDTGSWSTGGNATSATPNGDRTNSSTVTIGDILYLTGTAGWACISPATGSSLAWGGPRMRVGLNIGAGNAETVQVREIHQAIAATTIQGIQYDSGSTGPCSMVLVGSPPGLARNSLLSIDGEIIRVLAVIPTASGIGYSIRANATATHVATAAVTGLISWFCYCTQTHATTEPITAKEVEVSVSGSSGPATASLVAAIDGSAGGRPLDPANDWLHISVFLQNPQFVTNVVLLIDTGDGTFTESFYTYTIPPSQWTVDGTLISGGDFWYEILIPLSQGVLTGLNGNLGAIAAIQCGITLAGGNSSYGFSSWYLCGTYGPTIQPNAPTGYEFQSRFRDSSTGAASVPGPQNRYDLFPLREEILITPATTTAPGVDTCDIYVLGGTITPLFLYLGSVANNPGSPQTFSDTLTDLTVNEVDQPADLTKLQPWPLLVSPWAGTVNVVGTSVELVGGTPFNPNLLSATVIFINGVAYQTFGQPRSASFLELFTSAGVQSNVPYQIASPTLAAQPLPFAFGPLEGPFAPIGFALGDPLNAGTLYYSNSSDLDSASDQNTLELTGPSEPLVSGDTWNGLVIVGSRQNLYLVQYSFLGSPSLFQWKKLPSASGMWSRWACARCPEGVAFLGRDGIYIATDQGAVNISDAQLYSLFPHDGQAASVVNSGSNLIYPVDMTKLSRLRLVYCDNDLYFTYIDSIGNSVTLRYELTKKRWFLHNYFDQMNTFYLVEGDLAGPATQQMLQLSGDTGAIFLSGGDTDNGQDINTVVLSPSNDGGDERTQKLYVDTMTQADGTGTLQLAATFDNAQSFAPVLNIACTGSIQQSLENISSLADLTLHRNIGAKYAWTGGPSGPRLYAFEPSGYIQPYLSTFLVTQYLNLSLPGWKSHRRLYAGLISTAPVLFTISTQDGRTYGPYSIPSTGGRFKIFPIMLDQNIKDLALAYQLDGGGVPFAPFLESFTIETKLWSEDSFIGLSVFKT